MSDITATVFMAMQKEFGIHSIDNYELEMVKEFFGGKPFSDSYETIDHIKVKLKSKVGLPSEFTFYLNDLFKQFAITQKCIGAYIEGDYLNFFIKG